MIQRTNRNICLAASIFLVLFYGLSSQAMGDTQTFTIPLPGLIGSLGSRTTTFDFQMNFVSIQRLSIQCSGTTTPGWGCGDGVERPVFPYFDWPAQVTIYMDPGPGSWIVSIGPYDGSFSVEQSFQSLGPATWEFLLDGQAEITAYISPLIVIGGVMLVEPTATITEAYLTVEDVQVFSPPGDFDEDGEVDCDDLRVLALAWMSKSGDDNWNPDCDISDPNDEVIDGQDFGVFAMYWDGCGDPPPEPGMSYNIEDCDLAKKMAGPDKDALRFSATVQGNYILFEDMMTANCCPDELLLEITLEGDLITIYEIEYLTMPCYCICDWPVTATLGPFASGTYTLEVYEDWGGFIGSTIVTIE